MKTHIILNNSPIAILDLPFLVEIGQELTIYSASNSFQRVVQVVNVKLALGGVPNDPIESVEATVYADIQ